jgi:ABC-2 type transport system ATP-binding protein
VTASLSAPAFRFEGVSKSYGRTSALTDVSFEVDRGELIGLLGPNGAGKTTVIKLLLGLVRPTSGGGLVLGAPFGDRAARSRIGYLPELFRYQPWMTAREVLRLHTQLARMPRPGRRVAVDDALAVVGLVDRADSRVGGFSKGMQQRLGLGVALLGQPDLILLDEPTSALDPMGRMDVRAIIRSAADRGATIVLNSHLLTEVERVCDRVVILDRGRIVAAGSLDEIVPSDGVRLQVTPTDLAISVAASFGPCEADGDWLAVRPLAAARIPELVAAIVAAGGAIHAVEPGRGSLESRFLHLLTERDESR